MVVEGNDAASTIHGWSRVKGGLRLFDWRSPALPVAHTCFFHLDIPDYADEGEFVAKLTTAILECGTFDRV